MRTASSNIPHPSSRLPTASSPKKSTSKSIEATSTPVSKSSKPRKPTTDPLGIGHTPSPPTLLKASGSSAPHAKSGVTPDNRDDLSRSPSKLPKSPRSKLPSLASSGRPQHKSEAAMDQVSASGAPSSKKPSLRTSANNSPRTPSPKVVVTPSPPPTAEPSPQKAIKSASPTTPTPPALRPLELVPKESSPYVAAHLGEPCTINALDHLLTCGHKIITTAPEPCATNCQISPSKTPNPRSLDQPFVCLTCILNTQQTKHTERVTSFKQELQQVAKATKKAEPEKWIAMKVGIVEKAWRDVELQDMKEEVREGRFAYPVCVEPGEEGLVLEVAGAALREKGRKVLEAAGAAGKD